MGYVAFNEKQIEIELVCLYILVNWEMAENNKNECNDYIVRHLFNVNCFICNDIIESQQIALLIFINKLWKKVNSMQDSNYIEY